MPNQRELARHLSLSQGTVSLALRNSPLINEKTRRLVHEAAARLGYFPNPQVASLMTRIRQGRKVREQGCLALLVDFASESEWLSFHPAYVEQYDAIRRRASLRGYRTECFFLRGPGMSAATVDRILFSRGIVGVILVGPRQDSSYPVEMRWERYACGKAGYTWEEPSIDCVTANNRQHVELAFRRLTEKGCRRIGYCISRQMVPRADSNWVAGYLIAQRKLPAAGRLPMFVTDYTSAGRARFRKWVERWKPDAIVGGMSEYEWLQTLSLRRKPLFCFRFRRPEFSNCAVDENDAVIGETLCDLVIEQIIHNKRGIPLHPRLIQIAGSWYDPAA